jgi:hypothetical protein
MDSYQEALAAAGVEAGNGDRVRALEQALENRLAALTQQEKTLEKRLAAIEGTTGGPTPEASMAADGVVSIDEIWERSTPTIIQGSSLRTWSFANPAIKKVHVLLKTDGRPLEADVELWQGPDNTPQEMKVYVEDGALRTFSVFLDTPHYPNTVAVRNTGHMEFPLFSCVGPDKEHSLEDIVANSKATRQIVQGGALRTYPFDSPVDSVIVQLKTDGRPLHARIELLQGPNNNKQVIVLESEDGHEMPFWTVIQTPGSGNVVRILNLAPMEFPMTATVAAYEVNSYDWDDDMKPSLGRD